MFTDPPTSWGVAYRETTSTGSCSSSANSLQPRRGTVHRTPTAYDRNGLPCLFGCGELDATGKRVSKSFLGKPVLFTFSEKNYDNVQTFCLHGQIRTTLRTIVDPT